MSLAKRIHIDIEARQWFIPAGRLGIKSDEDHQIYLSDFAVRHFKALLAIDSGSEWVLPGESRGENKGKDTHLDEQTLQKSFADRQRARLIKGRSQPTQSLTLPGGPWRAHDLRRTGSTLMGELGIRPDVIDRCLNHSMDELSANYNLAKYQEEQREAFDLLGERLELLMASHINVIAPKNVA